VDRALSRCMNIDMEYRFIFCTIQELSLRKGFKLYYHKVKHIEAAK
jgi:hypothetical protein